MASRFKCSGLKMENGAEATENFGAWLSLPSSRRAAEPGKVKKSACGKKQNACSSVWRCGMGRARQSLEEDSHELWHKEGGTVAVLE